MTNEEFVADQLRGYTHRSEPYQRGLRHGLEYRLLGKRTRERQFEARTDESDAYKSGTELSREIAAQRLRSIANLRFGDKE